MSASRVRFIAVIVLIAGLVFLANRTLDFGELRTHLKTAQWGFLIPSSLLNVITIGVIVIRWKTLLKHRAPYLHCMAANQIGAYLNNLLPLRMGDFTRTYILQRHAPELSKVAIISSIGAELTFDMVVLLLLLAAIFFILPLPPLLTSAGALLTILTGIAVFSLFALARSDAFAEKIARPLIVRLLPHRLESIALSFLERAQDGLSSLRSNRQIIVILGWTVLGYAFQVISNWLLLRAFLDDIPIEAGLVSLVGAGLGLALPLLPGSTGTYELAVTLALTSFGIEPEAAAAFALVLHAQQFIITALMGSAFMLYEGVSVRELREAAQTAP